MIRALAAFFPLAVWAVAVLALGTVDFGPAVPGGTDKGAHFLLYAVGGAIAAWTGWKRRSPGLGWVALALVILTGAVDELHQSGLPYRDSDFLDWLADVAGALAGFAAGRLLTKD